MIYNEKDILDSIKYGGVKIGESLHIALINKINKSMESTLKKRQIIELHNYYFLTYDTLQESNSLKEYLKPEIPSKMKIFFEKLKTLKQEIALIRQIQYQLKYINFVKFSNENDRNITDIRHFLGSNTQSRSDIMYDDKNIINLFYEYWCNGLNTERPTYIQFELFPKHYTEIKNVWSGTIIGVPARINMYRNFKKTYMFVMLEWRLNDASNRLQMY